MWYHTVSCHTVSYSMISYNIISYHIMLCHIISCFRRGSVAIVPTVWTSWLARQSFDPESEVQKQQGLFPEAEPRLQALLSAQVLPQADLELMEWYPVLGMIKCFNQQEFLISQQALCNPHVYQVLLQYLWKCRVGWAKCYIFMILIRSQKLNIRPENWVLLWHLFMGLSLFLGSVHPAPRWVAYMNLCFCTSTLSACSFARLLFFHRSHFQKLQKTGGEELSIHRILLAIALMKYGQPRIFRQTHLPQLPHSMAEVKVCWTSINLKIKIKTYHGQRTPCVFNPRSLKCS